MRNPFEGVTDQDTDSDAIVQLTADHRRVAKLFAEFNNLGKGGSDGVKASLVKRICAELTIHATLEEELFYPAARKAIADQDVMDEAMVEHAGAKHLISQLQAAEPDDDLYDAKVRVLGEQIDHHVMEEEGSMFPQARAAGVDTAALGAELYSRRTQLLADADKPAELHEAEQGDEPSGSDGAPVKRATAPARSAARAAPRTKPKSVKVKRKKAS